MDNDYDKKLADLSARVTEITSGTYIPSVSSTQNNSLSPVSSTQQSGRSFLKIPENRIWVLYVAIPLVMLVIMVVFRPDIVTYDWEDEDSGEKKRKLGMGRLLTWSTMLSIPLLVGLYFVVNYKKKNPQQQ